MIATPHGGLIEPMWLDNFLMLDKPRGDGSGWVRGATLRTDVATARNILAAQFVQSSATHLLFWDDDVLAPRDGLMRLLAHNAPIVSGLYYTRAAPVHPVVYERIVRAVDSPLPSEGYAPVLNVSSGVREVDGVGAGFLLIRRDVMEALTPPWFKFEIAPEVQHSISEDLYFCREAQRASFPILCDFDVACGHLGHYVYDAQDYRPASE
jgi:hypothetical protein